MAANMTLTKTPMPAQDPAVRAKNFDEVATGYTEEMALNEAARCLGCKNMPCVDGCPVKIHIPEFIGKIKSVTRAGEQCSVISEAFSVHQKSNDY